MTKGLCNSGKDVSRLFIQICSFLMLVFTIYSFYSRFVFYFTKIEKQIREGDVSSSPQRTCLSCKPSLIDVRSASASYRERNVCKIRNENKCAYCCHSSRTGKIAGKRDTSFIYTATITTTNPVNEKVSVSFDLCGGVCERE